VNKIDLRKEKLLNSNSSLQYLWARHRIALLGDYNVLRNDPDRIKEVTQLGLDYNLLTAYTSFVAIDTEVRLVDGQAVTVKQPLPLPEGVSDYAVGKNKGTFTPRLAAPFATRAYEVDAKSQVKKDAEAKAGSVKWSVELGEITTSGGISKEDLQQIIKQQIPAIELCYQKSLEKKPNIQGEVTLQFVVDSKGKVIKVNLISGKLNDKKLEECISQKIKGLNFSSPTGTDRVTATVLFKFKSSS